MKNLLARFRKPRPGRDPQALLDLLGSHVAKRRVPNIAGELALPGRPRLAAPPVILVILFASRAGSSYAGRLLANTPYFNEVTESFRPGHLDIYRERHGLADTAATAQWAIDHHGTPQAFALKGGFSQLIAGTLLGLWPEALERTHFLLLDRRDRIAQAVSLFKAQESGRFHSVQPEGARMIEADYDADKIAFHLEHIARNHRRFAALLDELGRPRRTVIYEDICADPAGFVRETCDWIGLAPPETVATETDLAPLRDELSEAWIARFRREHPEAG
ncbi:MAG: Stf0 family sulfotransferase [Parasphingopyxis sp.]|nr:hypothetical protein [Sphingomonadales bacterium]